MRPRQRINNLSPHVLPISPNLPSTNIKQCLPLQQINPVRKSTEGGRPVYIIPLGDLDAQEPNQVFIITAIVPGDREQPVTPLIVELKECVEGG